jgi:hypothetical protein
MDAASSMCGGCREGGRAEEKVTMSIIRAEEYIYSIPHGGLTKNSWHLGRQRHTPFVPLVSFEKHSTDAIQIVRLSLKHLTVKNSSGKTSSGKTSSGKTVPV